MHRRTVRTLIPVPSVGHRELSPVPSRISQGVSRRALIAGAFTTSVGHLALPGRALLCATADEGVPESKAPPLVLKVGKGVDGQDDKAGRKSRVDVPLESVREVLFSPDGKTLAVRGEPGDPAAPRTIHLIDLVRRSALEWKVGTTSLAGMCFSHDGRWLAASASEADRGIDVWSMAAAKSVASFAGGVGRPVFLEDSATLAIRAPAGAGDVVRWNRAETGEETRRFPTPVVYTGELAPSGELMAATGRFNDATLRLIDVTTGSERRRFRGGEGQPGIIRFAPGNRTLAAAYPDGNTVLWEIATGEAVLTRASSTRVLAVAFSPGEIHLALGEKDGMLRVLEVGTGREILRWRAHAGAVSSVAFSPDGRQLATGSLDRTAIVWDIAAAAEPADGAMELTEPMRQQTWDELAAGSAGVAYGAMHRVRRTADASFAWLLDRARRQIMPPERGRIEVLIRELDHPDSAIRHRATEELKKLRELARPSLTALVRQSPSAEVRSRARRILQWGDRTPRYLDSDIRRLHRVLHLIESHRGAESIALCELMAREVPNDELRRNATRTLAVLKRPR